MTEVFACLDENEISLLAEGKGTAKETERWLQHTARCSKCLQSVEFVKEAIAVAPNTFLIPSYDALPEAMRKKMSRKQYAAMIGGYGRRNMMTGEAAFPKKLSLSDEGDYLCHCGNMLVKTGEEDVEWESDDVFSSSHVRFFECVECKSYNCTECPKEWMHDGISGLI